MAHHPQQHAEYAPPSGEFYYDYGEEPPGNWSGVGALECAWAEAEADWEVSFSLLPVLYMLVFVLGLSGNGLVIFTVWRGPPGKRRSADTYIGNLALADLAFVVTLPLWAAYTALRFHWPFGSALCKLSSYLVLLNMFASAFCLGCLSFERYLAIVHAIPRSVGRPASASSSGRARASTLFSLAGVWLLAGLLALPALLLRDTRPGLRHDGEGEEDGGGPGNVSSSLGSAVVECDMDFSSVASSPREKGYWMAALSLATTALGFVLPLLLMTLCYCCVGATVSRHFQQHVRKEEGRQRRRLLRIIVTLVAVFALCWFPFHLLKNLYVLSWVGLIHLPCAWLELIPRLHPYATCLAYINSCLNPFLYAFFDSRFRAQCLLLLGLRKALRAQAGSVSSTLSGQTQKSELPSLGTKV
ncbi:apelin receptor-like [Rhineura floridana]|uniref:apelin receptor-like n=1 Tax=Rhineura floridana TaxID=261503 RepID=UPI002AC8155D|nr:apelin receptor-like [Rhineura floridana]